MFSSEKGQTVLKWFIYIVIIISAFMAAVSVASGFIMDYYWFESIGYLGVFLTNIKYQLALLFLGWAVASVSLLLSWPTIRKSLGDQIPDIGGTLFKVFSIFAGFGIGWWFKGNYITVLKFLNQVPWGVKDPIFQMDTSFYVFTLPMIQTIITFIGVISGIVLFLSLFSFSIGRTAIEAQIRSGETELLEENPAWELPRFLKSWPVLGSIIALIGVGAVSVWLGRFSYLWEFNPGAPVPVGADFMAVNYLIPYTWVETAGVILFGVLIFRVLLNSDDIRERLEFGDFGALKTEAGLFVVVLVIFLVIPGVAFGAIDAISVQPNEPPIQESYIKNGIEFTNKAYDLEDITDIPYPLGSENLSSEEALESPTIQNARIVDYRPVKQTYQQKQRLRTYYEFHDLDVDRYQLGGERKELTIISGREMSRGSDSWQNKHLYYTHGFGAVLSPASRIASDGSPVLSVRDIPPVSNYDRTEVKKRRIYFGEKTNEYAIVNAGIDEFDYPLGENNEYHRYEYNRGIKIGGPWKKLVSWFYTGDFNILVSDLVGKDSKLFLHRNIHQRIEKITPFLKHEPNAQLFIDNEGGLVYMISGVTKAERYPYSYSDINAPGYLSDSVKTFIESNTGDVKFYIIENEPVAKTYKNIYPSLFKTKEKMPEVYKEHLIYPETLFKTQTNIYQRYHMKNYQTFYQKEDLWTAAQEEYHGIRRRIEPYNILYNVKNQPGLIDREEEFTLVQPFTPQGKQNMRAWVGATQDPQNYGKIFALKFPKGEQVQGPMQVESIISQNAEISQQISLWEGTGSKVLRGNLLALPVKNDILYIEPIYLSATSEVEYPQLKRIVAVYRDSAAMENTLERAVIKVLGGKVEPKKPRENVVPIENVAPIVGLVRDYLQLRENYNRLIGEGSYSEAGVIRERMAELEENMSDLISGY